MLIEAYSKILLLKKAGARLDTIGLFVEMDERTMRKRFLTLAHESSDETSFEVTDRYKKICFVFARVCKALICVYRDKNAAFKNWRTTADVDERLLSLVVQTAKTFFLELSLYVKKISVEPADYDHDEIVDRLKSNFEDFFSVNDSLEIFAATLAFELAETVKSSKGEAKTVGSISDAVSPSVRRQIYYFEEDVGEIKIMAKIGDATRALKNNKPYTIPASYLDFFELSPGVHLTKTLLDDFIVIFLQKIFFDPEEMKVMKTVFVQMQGSEVKVDFEAFNGAVKILGIEVAGIKESAAQMGSDLKKSVAVALLKSFPDFFKVEGTHCHEKYL